jgi:hypothetical protein
MLIVLLLCLCRHRITPGAGLRTLTTAGKGSTSWYWDSLSDKQSDCQSPTAIIDKTRAVISATPGSTVNALSIIDQTRAVIGAGAGPKCNFSTTTITSTSSTSSAFAYLRKTVTNLPREKCTDAYEYTRKEPIEFLTNGGK